ncbi:MAG: alcohol dehydrogenase catalytic domain-containing protein, partial [Steroidobacteraceae bacterium]|nr:alcohol dehydrogenase catalytic domain-containing protein [Steroidobacteraceae bacterium]MDW8259332.1 alcohol dehydrogenase catalytic domain-containing protein [Gammaproteobacteria bacterium]
MGARNDLHRWKSLYGHVAGTYSSPLMDRCSASRRVCPWVMLAMAPMWSIPSGSSVAAPKARTEKLMQAIVMRERGGPEVLELRELPVPQPLAGQVRIRVIAAGVNPFDWKSRDPNYRGAPGVPSRADESASPPLLPPLRPIPGNDVAGIVDQVGPGVVGWKRGDAVIAALHRSAHGGYAEYAIAYADDIAR